MIVKKVIAEILQLNLFVFRVNLIFLAVIKLIQPLF